MKTKFEELDTESLVKKAITMIMVGMALLVVYLVIGDFSSVKSSLANLTSVGIVLALLLTLSSYLIRFLKWHYLLKLIKVSISKKNSLEIFFIGLSMSITPGKVGEVFKCYLVKQKTGTPFWLSFPVIIVDRVADLIAMAVLIGLGTLLFDFGWLPFTVICLVLAIGIFFLQADFFQKFIIKATVNLKSGIKIAEILGSSRLITKAFPLSIISILSIIAWSLEGISMYVLVQEMQIDLTLVHTVFIFSLGTVAGAISMIPGGLGVAEGSITGLLLYFDVGRSDAVSLTVLIRLITLWFGVLVGFCIYFMKKKSIGS